MWLEGSTNEESRGLTFTQTHSGNGQVTARLWALVSSDLEQGASGRYILDIPLQPGPLWLSQDSHPATWTPSTVLP